MATFTTQPELGLLRERNKPRIPMVRQSLGIMLSSIKPMATQLRTKAINTELGPQLPSFNLPRRLFRWIYSVSLIILVSILLALISATPIDVIVHTSSASSSGIKLFIVIIVCVVFLVTSFFLYFSRIYQHRVSMNDIPNKSVYVPTLGDLPKPVFKHINKKFEQCQEVKVRAGPLTNENTNINYPGISPPLYIQERNSGTEGKSLPPNMHYNDVITSFCDKFHYHDGFTATVNLPKLFSLKEIMNFLIETLVKNQAISKSEVAELPGFLRLYEKFRFSNQLIEEKEMVQFMVDLNKLGDILLSNYGTVFSIRRKKVKHSFETEGASSTGLKGLYGDSESFSRSDFNYAYSDHDYSEESEDSDENQYLSSVDSYGSVVREVPTNQRYASAYDIDSSIHRMVKQPTNTSSCSIIKRKLSISEDLNRSLFNRRGSSVTFDLDTSSIRRQQSKNSAYVNRRKYSGGDSYDMEDVEHSESDTSIYNFRPRRPSTMRVPILNFEPASPERNEQEDRTPSPVRLLDLEIKRLRSPRKAGI